MWNLPAPKKGTQQPLIIIIGFTLLDYYYMATYLPGRCQLLLGTCSLHPAEQADPLDAAHMYIQYNTTHMYMYSIILHTCTYSIILHTCTYSIILHTCTCTVYTAFIYYTHILHVYYREYFQIIIILNIQICNKKQFTHYP